MAIDTAEKRRSAGGIPFLPLGVNVTPNALKDQEWRQQAAWGYSGILALNPAVLPDVETTRNLSRVDARGNVSRVDQRGNLSRVYRRRNRSVDGD